MRGFQGPEGGADVYHALTRAGGFVVTLAAGCGLATLHFRNPELFPLDA